MADIGYDIELAKFMDSLEDLTIQLTNEIERIAMEKGRTVLRDVLFRKLDNVLEEIFDENFIDGKWRKVEKWGKRLWKKIFN